MRKILAVAALAVMGCGLGGDEGEPDARAEAVWYGEHNIAVTDDTGGGCPEGATAWESAEVSEDPYDASIANVGFRCSPSCYGGYGQIHGQALRLCRYYGSTGCETWVGDAELEGTPAAWTARYTSAYGTCTISGSLVH